MAPDSPPAPTVIGVLGAGTMGAGIAQLACQSGARTLLHDPDPAALERGVAAVASGVPRWAARTGRSEAEAGAARARLEPVGSPAALAPCELVIEAAPESLELKSALFAQLAREVVAPDCVLATNTSSLPVTAIAAGVSGPERVVGMHFFNPPPVMPLLEVVAGAASAERALALARAAGAAMGKRVINATDGPGFLVNRCNRPFGLEALRLLGERAASAAEIDRIMRLGGGFRMGPFELMDLVGLDVGLEVARSFQAQSFGEPRWRPSPIVAQLVAAGRLGRKSGAGFYAYGDGEGGRSADPEPPAPGGGEGVVVISGESPLAAELSEAALAAGWEALDPAAAVDAAPPFLIVDVGPGEELPVPAQGGPRAVLCAGGSLAALEQGGPAVGFHAMTPLDGAGLVELTRTSDTAASAADAAERFFHSLGKHVAWTGDGPGLVLGRIVCQLVNEAAFALGEGVGSAEDIDVGMRLGVSHPRGPLRWGDEIGLDHVLTVLEALWDERREERYRPAPELTRRVWTGRFGVCTGEGFHSYE